MTAQQHALRKLYIALETNRWEFVQEAFSILDGAVHNEQKPKAIKHPREGKRSA